MSWASLDHFWSVKTNLLNLTLDFSNKSIWRSACFWRLLITSLRAFAKRNTREFCLPHESDTCNFKFTEYGTVLPTDGDLNGKISRSGYCAIVNWPRCSTLTYWLSCLFETMLLICSAVSSYNCWYWGSAVVWVPKNSLLVNGLQISIHI